MSKEIAQTVGGKKFGLLLVLLAALAVFATLASQFRGADAAFVASPTFTADLASPQPAGTTVTFTAVVAHDGTALAAAPITVTFPVGWTAVTAGTCTGTGLSATPTLTAGQGGQTATCSVTDTPTGSGAITFRASAVLTADSAGPTLNAAPATATAAAYVAEAGLTVSKVNNPALITPAGGTVTSTITVTNETATATTGGVVVTDAIDTANLTIAAGNPAGFTCTSANPAGWSAAGITTTDTTLLTCTSTAALAANTSIDLVIPMTVPASTTGVDVTDTANASAIINGATVTAAPDSATVTQGATGNVELRHVNEAGDLVVNADGNPLQDIFNNARGARHNVCLFTDTGVDAAQTPFNLGVPLNLSNIQITNGGGYKTTLDDEPNFTNPVFFTGLAGSDSEGANCFSYTSTGAGDQLITVVATIGGTTATIDWDSNLNGNGIAPANQTNNALVKEWNVLETSNVTNAGTAVSGAGTNNVVYNKSIPLTLNPVTGLNQFAAVTFADAFAGSHTTSTGSALAAPSLVGVNWTATLTGCGTINGGTAQVVGTTTSDTLGNAVPASVIYAGTNCGLGSTAKIVFVGQEPGALGSGVGNTVTQTVNITFTQASPVKQVLLAWAGQTVVLDHDWNIPAGLDNDRSPLSVQECSLDDGNGNVDVIYTKQAQGPGAFVAGSADQVTVDVGSDCISRALYESEDPGEVDITATAGSTPSNIAFVIYYMKLNNVNVSLVSQVSKPTHNSSVAADYAPGNPWDASKDAADNTATWNVSKDILVRGRVSGWFTNSNPSGRAADTTDPQNVLPANRWVMPDDWVNIAGGSALAGTFRPTYDLMFAPNNTSGIALGTPVGGTSVQVTTTVAGSGTGFAGCTTSTPAKAASPLKVAANTSLTANTSIMVGASGPFTILNVTGTSITLGATCGTTGFLAAAPAVGTPVLVLGGVPFEGPYSLIDIPGLAGSNGGNAGAALSSNGTSTRDTVLGDGVVDWWDAPMPPAPVSVSVRGTGYLKQVIKSDVYYLGTPNSSLQVYPNPYYIQNIPANQEIPAVSAGGGYLWNSWNGQGAYTFWTAAVVGTNSAGIGDATVTATQATELAAIRTAFTDSSIARDLVVYSDNHGEFMVTANGDFKTDLSACATNALAGGKLCATGDEVGTGTISAVADYPQFKKHFPVASNTAEVTWTWGGYKDVTVEAGETDQFKYVVFHAMDRDGFCSNAATGAVLLHPVLTSNVNNTFNNNPSETIDFLIDSGEGIILSTSGGNVGGSVAGAVNDGKQFAQGVPTYSVADEAAAATGKKVFPLSDLAGEGQVDECQAWIKVSNSLLGTLNVLTVAHNDEGNEGFDRVIDLTGTTSYTLNFRWSLITWAGANNISVADAIKGGEGTANPDGNDISAQVTAIYGWNQSAQTWLGFFPTGVDVPGANNLNTLTTGQAYWIAITGPGSVTWTVTTDVGR